MYWKTISHSGAEGNFQRQSGMRGSLSFSVKREPRQLSARCVPRNTEEKRRSLKEGYIEAVWERFGSTTSSSAAFKKKARSATSKRTVHLGHPRRQPGDIKPQRETCCSKIRISSHSAKSGLNLCIWFTSSCRKCNRLKCMCSPTRYYVWDRTRCPTQ